MCRPSARMISHVPDDTRCAMCVETKSQSHQLRFKPTIDRQFVARAHVDPGDKRWTNRSDRPSAYRARRVQRLTRLLKGYSNSLMQRAGQSADAVAFRPLLSVSPSTDRSAKDVCPARGPATLSRPQSRIRPHTASYGLIRPHTARSRDGRRHDGVQAEAVRPYARMPAATPAARPCR